MNIKIELTDREVFAITQSGIREISKRRQFGTIELSRKIYDQLILQITPEQFSELKKEWQTLKSDQPAITEKKKKILQSRGIKNEHKMYNKDMSAPDKYGTRVWKP